jgi:hypothetical protein
MVLRWCPCKGNRLMVWCGDVVVLGFRYREGYGLYTPSSTEVPSLKSYHPCAPPSPRARRKRVARLCPTTRSAPRHRSSRCAGVFLPHLGALPLMRASRLSLLLQRAPPQQLLRGASRPPRLSSPRALGMHQHPRRLRLGRQSAAASVVLGLVFGRQRRRCSAASAAPKPAADFRQQP